jgi:methylphosphotriester-DNA--protein-cysteine methyltransferase
MGLGFTLMECQRRWLDSSKNTKVKLIKRLEKKYGKNWKTPLAKDMGVDLSTVRRAFNQRDKLSPVWVKAIEQILTGDC